MNIIGNGRERERVPKPAEIQVHNNLEKNKIINLTLHFHFTCVAKTSNSPTAKRTMKPYKLLRQKAPKQNIAPKNVAPERSY